MVKIEHISGIYLNKIKMEIRITSPKSHRIKAYNKFIDGRCKMSVLLLGFVGKM